MPAEKKKQFSLSLAVTIFLAIVALISIGVFANSIMYYNQIDKEVKELEETLTSLYQTRAELQDLLGSSEELNDLLSDYRKCDEMLKSNSLEGEVLQKYTQKMKEVRELLQNSKYKDHISKIAKDELNLYFADEKIFYNDDQ